jgi:hypothetical protein
MERRSAIIIQTVNTVVKIVRRVRAAVTVAMKKVLPIRALACGRDRSHAPQANLID